nr:hypothetical protein [Pseudomonas baetica]
MGRRGPTGAYHVCGRGHPRLQLRLIWSSHG